MDGRLRASSDIMLIAAVVSLIWNHSFVRFQYTSAPGDFYS